MPGVTGITLNFRFDAGLRYGVEFLRSLFRSGQYLLPEEILAERRGPYYRFSVHLLHAVAEDDAAAGSAVKGEDLIDMDSPILKKPVHQSPLKLRRAESQRGPG